MDHLKVKKSLKKRDSEMRYYQGIHVHTYFVILPIFSRIVCTGHFLSKQVSHSPIWPSLNLDYMCLRDCAYIVFYFNIIFCVNPKKLEVLSILNN